MTDNKTFGVLTITRVSAANTGPGEIGVFGVSRTNQIGLLMLSADGMWQMRHSDVLRLPELTGSDSLPYQVQAYCQIIADELTRDPPLLAYANPRSYAQTRKRI